MNSNENLIKVFKEIALGCKGGPSPAEHKMISDAYGRCYNNDYITQTWQAVSDVIRVHMDAYSLPKAERQEFLKNAALRIKNHYPATPLV